MLSGGGIFLLAMAMHAASLWNIQHNIQELTGVNQEIRGLAVYSARLASVVVNRPRRRELARREIAESPTAATPTPITALSPPFHSERRQSRSTGDVVSRSTAPEKHVPYNPLAYGKWGPPLITNFPKAPPLTATRDAIAEREQVQADLRALGFDVSADKASGRTRMLALQALNEFSLLYLSPAAKKTPDNDRLAASIRKYAALARKDARKFKVESGILAALRLGSQRTGVEFSFLMELAATESSFDPTSVAPTTAAAGLYQFKDDTWLEAVRRYGDKYGMSAYASQIENYTDQSGNRRLRIRSPGVQDYVLALRYNPRVSALLAAEYVKLNRKQLSASLDYEPGHTEMYLTHFLGATGAISFLKALAENPERIAGEIFPIAAEHNRALFSPERGKPRTVAELYKLFERKFSRSRYRNANPG